MHNGSVFHRKISFRGNGLGREPWAVFQSNLIPCSRSPRPTPPTAGRFQCYCRTSSAPCARTGADQIILLYRSSAKRRTIPPPAVTVAKHSRPLFYQARPAGPRPQGAPDPRRKPAGHPPKTARNPPGHRLPRTRPRRSGRPGFPRADGRSSHRHQPRPGETRWPGTGAHPGRERPPGAGTAETNPK